MKQYARERPEIKRIIKEEIELEYYNVRNYAVQFEARFVSGEGPPEGSVILISFNTTNPRDYSVQRNAFRVWNQKDYYGKLEIIYCKKKKTLFGKEKLKKEKFYQKIYTQKMWRGNPEKISLMEFIGEEGIL